MGGGQDEKLKNLKFARISFPFKLPFKLEEKLFLKTHPVDEHICSPFSNSRIFVNIVFS